MAAHTSRGASAKEMNPSDLLEGLSGDRLPLHLKPREDELLSSWLIRLAHVHQFKVESLCTRLFGYQSTIWNRDIDLHAPEWVLARLCQATGATSEQAHRTTLVDLEGRLAENISSKGHNNWIVPLGIFHRNRRHPGLMYCPACLAEEPSRYYRRLWRIAWASICVRHRCLLVDCCPACGAPVAPHRADMKGRSLFPTPITFICCHVCQQKLSQQPLMPASATQVAFQSLLETTLAQGFIDWDDNPSLHSVPYFDGLRALLTCGLRAMKCRDPEAKRSPIFESQSLAERRTGLLQLSLWIENWPHRFLEAITTNQLRSSELCSLQKPLPYWYYRVVHPLTRLTAPTSEQEAEAIMTVITKQTGTHNLKAAQHLAGKDITPAWHRMHERRVPSMDDYEMAVVAVDHQIAATIDHPKRLLLLRHKFMLVARYGLGLSSTELAQLTLADIFSRVQQIPAVRFYAVPRTPGQAAAWLLWYYQHVRPQMHPVEGKWWVFVNAKTGNGLSANACRHWTHIPRVPS